MLLKKKNNLKIIFILAVITILISLCTFVHGSPGYFYPSKYVVTLKNIGKDEIKSIEMIYPTRYAFNYAQNEKEQYWIKNTTLDSEYKEYSDEEIIPTLTTEEIDIIAKSYINTDTSDVKGYWIDKSVINARSNSITKFAICNTVDVKYKNNNTIVTYTADDENEFYINNMYMRIVKNDDTIIYSNYISSNMEQVVDEFSTDKEWKEAEKVKNKTAYFEIDSSEIKSNFEVTEINKEQNNTNNSNDFSIIIMSIVIVIAFVIICVILKNIKKRKNRQD